ncbi:MAG: hypothetical protein AABZ53_05420 [Planctomycetota bacterium]
MNKRSRIGGRLAWGMALVAAWIAPVAVSLCPTTAIAQVGLNPAIVSASPLSAQDKADVAKYVKDLMPDLRGGGADPAKEAAAVKKARTELTAPLLMKAVSVPFRQEYSRLLIQDEKLADLCKDKKDLIAINALRLAGETAASEMIALITGQLGDQRTSVRYAAGYATQRLFEQCAPVERSPAVTMDSLVEVVAKISARLSVEKEPLVFDMLVRSLFSASLYERPKSEGVRSAAIKAMCGALSAGLKNAKFSDKTVLSSVVGIASEFRTIMAARGPQWAADDRKEVMGLAGDMVTWVANRVAAKELENNPNDAAAAATQKKEDRKAALPIVRLAEVLIQETLKAEGIVGNKQIILADHFEKGTNADDARFTGAFDAVVEDILVKKPFEFKSERFKYK